MTTYVTIQYPRPGSKTYVYTIEGDPPLKGSKVEIDTPFGPRLVDVVETSSERPPRVPASVKLKPCRRA